MGEVKAYASARDAVADSGDVELLILDTAARTNRATVDIARMSHLIVQPTGASADDLEPAVLTFHELVKEGIPKDRLVMAICRVLSEGEEATVRAYVADAGYQVLDGAIPERIGYREAQNRGRAITETTTAKLNRRADALMQALLDKVADAIEQSADGIHRKGTDKHEQGPRHHPAQKYLGQSRARSNSVTRSDQGQHARARRHRDTHACQERTHRAPRSASTPDEKKRLELMAVRENVSLNELFARMLALYEAEHGRVAITSADKPAVDDEHRCQDHHTRTGAGGLTLATAIMFAVSLRGNYLYGHSSVRHRRSASCSPGPVSRPMFGKRSGW